jgi:hypothetical protein
MTEPPYWLFFLGITLFIVSAFYGIVKARRRNEPVYYWVSGICVLQIIAFAAILLNQFLVFFATMGLSVIVCIGLLPRIMELNREEIVKQKQETNSSAPLRMRDFLTWKGWIKFRAIHGLRKMLTVYILFNTGIVAALVLASIIFSLMPPRIVAVYAISYTAFSSIISYHQLRKALKEP